MVVQWLGLCAATAGVMGSNPGQGTKIPHAVWHGQEIKKKKDIKPQILEDKQSHAG